jgi:hypothetical protein
MKTLQPMLGVRGKKLNLYNLKYMIEEIYSIRFIKDTSNLRNQLVKQRRSENNEEVDNKDPFPIFCVEFLINKYVKKNLVDQHALDMLISVEFYKSKFKEIEIFNKFLNEEYDADDLIFFLFVRSCIEKEMKIMFIEKAREEIKVQYNENRDDIDTEVYLNVKNCLKSKKPVKVSCEYHFRKRRRNSSKFVHGKDREELDFKPESKMIIK